MGYTNTTTHYELPQYVATDKPKYLTDFNETMVAIDTQMYTNAQAAATADGKAVAAKDVADGAVLSIGTLDAQINGDPTDPSDTGLAGEVSGIDTELNTVQSLIGNGQPTSSDQTIIGAVNSLEAAIAPREDSADLANSYSVGDQFARGGSVYEALVSLTAGTAFASLVLNTDYKVSDTIVEQIKEAGSAATAAGTSYDNTLSGLTADDVQEAIDEVVGMIPTLPAGYLLTTTNVNPEVTADGVKTYKELLTELFALVNTTQAAEDYDAFILAWISVDGKLGCNATGLRPYGRSATTTFQLITSDTTSVTTAHIEFKESTSTYHEVVAATAGNTFTDKTNAVPADGLKISVRMYKAVPQNIS